MLLIAYDFKCVIICHHDDVLMYVPGSSRFHNFSVMAPGSAVNCDGFASISSFNCIHGNFAGRRGRATKVKDHAMVRLNKINSFWWTCDLRHVRTKYYIVNLYMFVKVQLRPCLWQIESWPLFGMSWRGFSKTENRDATEQLGIARLRRRCADIIWRDPIGYLQETCEWRMSRYVKWSCQFSWPTYQLIAMVGPGLCQAIELYWTILNLCSFPWASRVKPSSQHVTAIRTTRRAVLQSEFGGFQIRPGALFLWFQAQHGGIYGALKTWWPLREQNLNKR